MPADLQSIPLPGTVVPSGALIAPSGSQGAIGPTGPIGSGGPTGPAGPTAISTNAGNLATLGSDNLILVPPSVIVPLSKYYGADIGTATAYAVPVNNDFQLIQGVVVFVIPSNTSGASPTLNVNSTGAKPLVTRAGIAVSANEIGINRMFGAMYDGVNWRIITPLVRNYFANNPGNVTIECAGYDAVSIVVALNASSSGITLAHVANGIPVNIMLVNSGATTVSWWVNFTTMSGGTGGVTFWLWSNSLSALTAAVRIDSTSTQNIVAGSNILLIGSLMANGQMIFL
jgi:hypothetical protein